MLKIPQGGLPYPIESEWCVNASQKHSFSLGQMKIFLSYYKHVSPQSILKKAALGSKRLFKALIICFNESWKAASLCAKLFEALMWSFDHPTCQFYLRSRWLMNSREWCWVAIFLQKSILIMFLFWQLSSKKTRK